jgi:imidazoleglycerol-phosphate dehydratase
VTSKMSRTASKKRKTQETEIQLDLDLDGGEAAIATGVGFLDHMLELLARHGRLGLRVEASGDLDT